MSLVERMRETAKKKPVKIIVCEGWDERCLRSSESLLKEGICNIALLGNPAKIQDAAKKFGVDISKAEIVDPNNPELRKELATALVEARKHKGMDLSTAEKLLDDVNYFSCMYALTGHCDGVAGSAIGSTAELMRPALQILRKKGIVSEVFVVSDPNDRVFFVSDASMNIDPTSEQLVNIGENALTTVQQFGIVPKVAFLSFSTKGSGGDNPQTERVREATQLFQKEHPDVLSDGELQLDAAVNPDAAQKKCPDSPLKGEANILVMPNLTAANLVAHAVLQFSNLSVDFTIIAGMKKPVGIIGRSVPLEVVENVIVSCAMQANS